MASNTSLEPPSSSTDTQEHNNLSKLSFKALNIRGLGLFREKMTGIPIFLNSLIDWITSLKISNQYLPHLVMVVLLILAVTSNINDRVNAAAQSRELISLDPDSEISIIDDIDDFTPVIEADAAGVERSYLVASASDGFIESIGPMETTITSRIEPLPDNSGGDVNYTIRPGDTLTGLSYKFGVKTSTLKYLNNIDNINSIKPGSILKVPKRGYEVPASQIAKREKERQAKLALANAKRNTVARGGTDKRTYNGNYEGDSDGRLIRPVPYYQFISRGIGSGHTGVDYACQMRTPILASASGVVKVVSYGWSGGYGNMIVIDHGNGLGTRYGHLSSISVVPGQTVSQGQTIGLSGNTGRSTGPHLHFEKLINGRWAYIAPMK